MDINQSTVQGNCDTLENLFGQGGVGDPQEKPGDLSTCERVQSLQQSCAEEVKPWRQFQFVIFVMGLFHLKMVCADALWKIFIQLKVTWEDEMSLMKQVTEIRPKETSKIGSKPGTKPSWEDIEAVATILISKYIAGNQFSEVRIQPPESRDQKLENTLLKEQYFLLYEEMSYALNARDIGRVEDCFMPWIFIFKGCGKHKYATQMLHFLHNLHFVYPARLKRAICMNILCNPTGQKAVMSVIEDNL
ncbi:hypothetical protein BKA93DRAFT_819274 [Sparassis latifolia]